MKEGIDPVDLIVNKGVQFQFSSCNLMSSDALNPGNVCSHLC